MIWRTCDKCEKAKGMKTKVGEIPVPNGWSIIAFRRPDIETKYVVCADCADEVARGVFEEALAGEKRRNIGFGVTVSRIGRDEAEVES